MLLDNLCYRVNTCFTKIIPCITWLRVLYGLSLFSQGSFLVLLDYLCYRVITYFTEMIPGVTGLFLFFLQGLLLCFLITTLFPDCFPCMIIFCFTGIFPCVTLLLHYSIIIPCVTRLLVLLDCLSYRVANNWLDSVLPTKITSMCFWERHLSYSWKYTKMEIHSKNLAFEGISNSNIFYVLL